MRPINADRDIPRQIDLWAAKSILKRRDGGSVSDSAAEFLGTSKTTFHQGLVGLAALAAAAKFAPQARGAGGALFVLILAGVAAKVGYNYLEAPRYKLLPARTR